MEPKTKAIYFDQRWFSYRHYVIKLGPTELWSHYNGFYTDPVSNSSSTMILLALNDLWAAAAMDWMAKEQESRWGQYLLEWVGESLRTVQVVMDYVWKKCKKDELKT